MVTSTHGESIRHARARIRASLELLSRHAAENCVAEQAIKVRAVGFSCDLRVLKDGSVWLVNSEGESGEKFKSSSFSALANLCSIDDALRALIRQADFVAKVHNDYLYDHRLVIEVPLAEKPSADTIAVFYAASKGSARVQPSKFC